MNEPNDFLTVESLLTFGGATLATVVVPNALQAALQFNPRWLALFVAQIVCIAVVLSGPSPSFTSLLVAFVNGCLVYCSALGLTTIGASAHKSQPPVSKGDSARASQAKMAPRHFFSPWF